MVLLTPSDAMSTRDLCEGVLVIGNPGSGKTSTTGTIIPLAALRAGWGVAAYTTKPDDVGFWINLCRMAGREGDLRIIRPGGGECFNLIRYELERTTVGGGNTLKLAANLMEVFREGRPQVAASETSEFFDGLGQILLCNGIDAHRLAGEPISFKSLWRFIESVPKDPGGLLDPHWQRSPSYEILARASEKAATSQEIELNETVASYFTQTLPHMNERTRGDVLATIQSALFQLSRDPVRELLDASGPRANHFRYGCSFVPESLDDGAVLIIDCPASVHGPLGRMLSICFKRLVKEALRRRQVRGDLTRPILQFCDECQTYATRDDADFQQVCRSNRVATVFLTQSIDNLEAVLGSDAHTNSLANALTTHVYHCTSGKTAEWIERRIAQSWQPTQSTTLSGRGDHQSSHGPSISLSKGLSPQILASELSRLRTGGPLNHNLVEAVAFKPGRSFRASDAPFVRVRFEQA